MTKLRKHSQAGDICFITAVTIKRCPLFSNAINIKVLIQTLNEVRCIKKCDIFSYVILPDHVHMIFRSWDYSSAEIVHSLKRNFTLNIKKSFGQSIFAPMELWQPRFWEHIITSDRDLISHLNYLYSNPVKHGLVEEPDDWPYSSFTEHALQEDMGVAMNSIIN